MKSIPTLLIAISLTILFTGCKRRAESVPKAETSSAAKIEWLTDFDTAKAQARAQNKTLLINFTGSDWCPPCILLERQVFSQPEFREYATQHLVLLEVDFPRMKELSDEQKAANEKLAERYEIDGFPTVVVLDSNGKTLGRLGYRPGGPKAFLAVLEKLPATQ